MSVKTTIILTRKEAEDKYISLKQEMKQRSFRAEAVGMDNHYLEASLERMNDFLHEGEGFENYSVSEKIMEEKE